MFGSRKRSAADVAFDARLARMDRETTEAHERVLVALQNLILCLEQRPLRRPVTQANGHGSNAVNKVHG